MQYSLIINDMTWSYSRLSAYEDCPYRFFLLYLQNTPKERHFFAEYGTFMHLIIQKFLTGELKKEQLPGYYLVNFRKNVRSKAPSQAIFENYFLQGLDYCKNFQPADEDILGVETQVRFSIGRHSFIGYIDKLSRTKDGIVITDNKSKILRPRSGRSVPTKTDQELDSYLKQLYLYSLPVREKFGEFPVKLSFNCYRANTSVTEPFRMDAFQSTAGWASELIDKIANESEWDPNIEPFKCENICSVSGSCEYYQMYRR